MVHNDGKGRQRVEVDHRSEWRFLWHHGSFTTSLLVEQVGQIVCGWNFVTHRIHLTPTGVCSPQNR